MQAQIRTLQKQLQSLQKQVSAQEVKDRRSRSTGSASGTQQAAAGHQEAAAGRAVKGPLPFYASCGQGSFSITETLCLKPVGFIELASIYRTRNLVSDVATDFNGIPFANLPTYHEREFRFTARQTRVGGLLTARIDPSMRLTGYVDGDFLAAGVTSNSRLSNSYLPRLRQGWAAIDLDNVGNGMGLHVLAGQAWSLLTTHTTGIIPLKEQIPLAIDQNTVGFNWIRVPQVRVVGQINPAVWAGLSIETPQAVLPPSPFAPPVTINVNNPGDPAGLMNSTTTYSNDVMPDVVGKLAFDPGFGHYEAKALARRFTDRTFGATNEAWGYGIGGAATVPIIPNVLDVQASGLVGRGIGRYATSQLPDFALRLTGAISPVPMAQLLVGAVATPLPGTQIYIYAGLERASRAGDFSTTLGYGSPTLVNTGCTFETAPATTCQAETREIKEISIGVWQDIYRGSYGRAVLGAQGSYAVRHAFPGIGGAPSTNVGMLLASLRYYPFPP
jgi:hypothetical protein